MSEETDRTTDDVFNLTIVEVRLVTKFRALSLHQQRGIIQALELIRPGAAPPVSSGAPRQ
jgi:hypothetical protein